MSLPLLQTDNLRSTWKWTGLIALLVLMASAPTLSRLEFSSSMENLNAATVLEIRRSGNWLMPTLEGELRVNKPPLTAWVTTLFVPESAVERLNESDPALRESAYRDLAFRIRLAPLLQTCVTMLLVGAIAATVFGRSAAVIAAVAYATSFLVVKLGRTSTTDVQMTMWIALAQLGVALALWRDRRWIGGAIAGVATGLALMSKGPVCLLFIVLPLVLLLILRAIEPENPTPSRLRLRKLKLAGPLALAALLTVAIGTPWYVAVYMRQPTVIAGWTTEVTRQGATENASSNPAAYLAIFPFLTPWLPWAIVGLLAASGDLRRRLATPAAWLLIAGLLPLVVMSFFPDRKDRYALPAMIPLAILAAHGVREMQGPLLRKVRRTLEAIHYITLAVVAIGLPIAGAVALQTIDGNKWFSLAEAGAMSIGMGAALVIALMWQRKNPLAFVGATLVIMLAAQAVIIEGYRDSRSGRSEMKPLADAIRHAYPAAGTIINTRDRKRMPVDLAIYLNQTTQRNPEWKSLPPQTPPAIAIVLQNGGSPEPTPPAGWKVLAKVPRDRDFWWAFVQTDLAADDRR